MKAQPRPDNNLKSSKEEIRTYADTNEQDAAAPRPDDAAGSPRTRPDAQSKHPDARSVTARTEAAWQAIVEQLLATPAHDHPDEAHLADEAQRAPEYAWARKLGVHINRPPKRR